MLSSRHTTLFVAFTLPVMAMASPSFPDSYSSLGLEAGYVDSGNSDDKSGATDDLDNYAEFGLNFTHQFNPRVSMLIQASHATTETRNFNQDADILRGSIGARFHPTLYRLRDWRPFVGAGYSHANIDLDSYGSESEDMLYGEAGLQNLIAPRFIAEVGVRGRVEIEDQYVDAQAFAGVHYVFGREFSAAPTNRKPLDFSKLSVPVADSDGDGVPDQQDKCPGTPRGALVDDDGCAKELTREIKETLYVEFAHDKTEVAERYYPKLQNLVTTLKQYPTSRILLEGHTDSTGPSSYNQKLSKSRADAVMKVLIDHFGIHADRIRTTGMGESQPIASNDTDEGRGQNRRVEAIVSGEHKEIMKKPAQ
ncbi:OmpA family protein [Marinobacter litoralis]|uniref:OmpA family protein n=1 Tax=Marinobacter litoralis TaxID=187981 RepID=UPI0018EBA9AB|nr:OmpA family protein [Marinobacter litoralis]MBJ6138624.1 OmpA family protein [Marinobacter litoralis]